MEHLMVSYTDNKCYLNILINNTFINIDVLMMFVPIDFWSLNNFKHRNTLMIWHSQRFPII